MDERLPSRDIVLIGAGHTNMHIVQMWRMLPIPDVRLTLITPYSRPTYSGMLPGTLAGLYSTDDMEIDVYRFAAPAGVRVIVDEATGIDMQRRRVTFRERPPIRFDVASIGTGSVPVDGSRWSSNPVVLPIKPMATFRDRLSFRIHTVQKNRAKDSAANSVRIAVVGAGAAGIEITLCLRAFLQSRNINCELSLIDSGSEVLRGYLPGTIRRVREELSTRGIAIRLNSRVATIDGDSVMMNDGTSFPADIIVWSTGAAPSPFIQALDLPKGRDGFIAVRNTLQVVDDSPVFAVGDSGSLIDSPVKKAGVYAVREGPVLWKNIQRFLNNRPLVPYKPQKGFLSLLADGNGGAFLDYKGLSAHGSWAWKLKDRIDRKFMRMYQDYAGTALIEARGRMTESSNASVIPAMRCRGCGGKAGAGVLHAAFERLRDERPDSSHNAFQHAEDAAAITHEHSPDLITVDFFQSFVDDPWLVGRIAALNSLSDIWATGGQPTQTLAMVQLPEGDARQQTELLYQLLAGALHEFDCAQVELIGGHTTEATELTIGFTVIGTLNDQQPLLKNNAQPGDALILTKPLGTGVLLAGLPQARSRGEWIDTAINSMLKPNSTAANVAREFDVNALTDITGFGLAGHLLELLDASQSSAEIHLERLPLLPGAGELLKEGLQSTLAPANQEVQSRIMTTSTNLQSHPAYKALFDPQTSGGLLLAVSGSDCDSMIARLNQHSVSATVIGQVSESKTDTVLTVSPQRNVQ